MKQLPRNSSTDKERVIPEIWETNDLSPTITSVAFESVFRMQQ